MIRADARLAVCLLPLSALVVTEYQARYPARVQHYAALMTAHPDQHAGVVSVQRRGEQYEILDGHHRLLAAILTGRSHLLCLVIDERLSV